MRKLPPKVWIFTTYFMEGLPYTVIRVMSSIFFTDIGVKERYIGYLNFLGIPWNLKFLWAPFMDIFLTKRLWMVLFQILITIFIVGVSMVNFIIPAGANPEHYLVVISLSFVVLAFFSLFL